MESPLINDGHFALKEGATERSEDGINGRFRDINLAFGDPQVPRIIVSALCRVQFLKHVLNRTMRCTVPTNGKRCPCSFSYIIQVRLRRQRHICMCFRMGPSEGLCSTWERWSVADIDAMQCTACTWYKRGDLSSCKLG